MDAAVIFFLFVEIVLYTFQSFLGRSYAEHYPGSSGDGASVLTVCNGLAAALMSFALAGFSFEWDALTVILGVCNALMLFLYNVSLVTASKTGPYSVLMVFMIAGGILIPTGTAAFFGEYPSIGKLLSVLAVLIGVYLVSQKGMEAYTDKRIFYLACTGLALCNGAYGSLLNAQQQLTGEALKNEMVCVTFFGSMLFSALYVLYQKRGSIGKTFRQTKKSGFYLASCAFVSACAVSFMVRLIAMVGNVTVLYTFDNTGVLLVSVILSWLFLKEKLTAKNVVGCILMCAALIGVSVL